MYGLGSTGSVQGLILGYIEHRNNTMAAWDLLTTWTTYYYTRNVSCNLWVSYFADGEGTSTDTSPYYTAPDSVFCSWIQTSFLSVLDSAAAGICCFRLEIQAQDSLGTSSHHPVSRDTGSCTVVPITVCWMWLSTYN